MTTTRAPLLSTYPITLRSDPASWTLLTTREWITMAGWEERLVNPAEVRKVRTALATLWSSPARGTSLEPRIIAEVVSCVLRPATPDLLATRSAQVAEAEAARRALVVAALITGTPEAEVARLSGQSRTTVRKAVGK